MSDIINLKKFSFLVYGLGASGSSVIQYFKKKKKLSIILFGMITLIYEKNLRLKIL